MGPSRPCPASATGGSPRAARPPLGETGPRAGLWGQGHRQSFRHLGDEKCPGPATPPEFRHHVELSRFEGLPHDADRVAKLGNREQGLFRAPAPIFGSLQPAGQIRAVTQPLGRRAAVLVGVTEASGFHGGQWLLVLLARLTLYFRVLRAKSANVAFTGEFNPKDPVSSQSGSVLRLSLLSD